MTNPTDSLLLGAALEDPRLEAKLFPRVFAKAALMVAGGGCAALTLVRRYPDVAITAFDPRPAQIAHLRAKQEAAEAGDLAKLNVETDDPSGLAHQGAFAALMGRLRAAIEEHIAPREELDAFFGRERTLTELDSLVRKWLANKRWAGIFEDVFGEPARAVLGPEEARGAPRGSYPVYFRRQLEWSLRRDAAPENPYLQIALAGRYRRGSEPYFARNCGPLSLETVEGDLDAVPDLGRFDLVSLGSLLDTRSDDEVRSVGAHLSTALRPGAAVLLRQLASQRDLAPLFGPHFAFDVFTARRFAESDRSIVHHRFEVAVRR